MILSNNINIIIESIDFDIGLINYNFKSFNNYLRIKRIFDLTNNLQILSGVCAFYFIFFSLEA